MVEIGVKILGGNIDIIIIHKNTSYCKCLMAVFTVKLKQAVSSFSDQLLFHLVVG